MSVRMVVGDGRVTVSIEDSGIGIPLEKQSGVFAPFYRAHTGTPWDYGGMGVGLYIARETVIMHEGQIWFESTEGRGSTFHFSLPVEERG